MFFHIIAVATLTTLTLGSPIESHANSYISTSFGGYGNLGSLGGDDQGGLGGHVIAAPVFTHHAVPLVHKVVTPVIQKVPVYVKHVEQHVDEEHGPAEYQFQYAVEDKHTGDIKSQKEVRHGDQVQGEYSLKEADGTVRIVKYTADKENGFNAVVVRQGHAVHPQVVHKEVQVKNVVVPIIAVATLATLTLGSPIESYASSYISTSFGGYGNVGSLGSNEGYGNLGSLIGDDQGGFGGHVVAAPVVTHHAVPLVHKVVTPVIQKVPLYVNHVGQHVEEEHGPAEYQFQYAVEDKHTGDIKSQKEVRHGDQVQGEYSLKEADGTVRIVKYTADKKNGFNAVVVRQGHAAHPQVVHKEVQVRKVVVPVIGHHHDGYQQFLSHY
ncbi:hypothetical protein Trydic_g14146 [Trypoxylus dichotomus]